MVSGGCGPGTKTTIYSGLVRTVQTESISSVTRIYFLALTLIFILYQKFYLRHLLIRVKYKHGRLIYHQLQQRK
jgi:hypothetical protein